LLDERTLQPLPLLSHLALLVLLGIAFGTLVARLDMTRAAGLTVVAAGLYGTAALWLFTHHGVWLPLVVPALLLGLGFGTSALLSYRDVAMQRERVRTALGYYVPKSVARRLSDESVSAGANRQVLQGTCLVTDAEHYTSIGETLAPTELAALMNEYYGAVFDVVQAHGGEISDTAGDSMVAVWPSAGPEVRRQQQAVEAGIAILGAVADFNRAHPHAPLPTRVGIETGEMLLGNIGAEQRYEYRAIGDIVNTASRIQGLNQVLGTQVLVSASTLEGTSDLPTRDVGTFLLRGKRLPVRVLEPLAASGRRIDANGLDAFAAAIAAFRAGAWHDAHERFASLAALFQDDGPSRYYERLTREWREHPPASWQGAVRLTAK
jgi:adenylate cyclase